MRDLGHYSPDGRWWWNGSRWVAVSERATAGGARARIALPIVSAVVIVLLGALGVLTFAVSGTIVKNGLGFAVPGGGGAVAVGSVTTSLEKSGFECSLGYTTPAKVWFCFQTRSHDYAYLGIQVRDSDGVGWVTATVARNASGDPDVTPRATQVFAALAAAVVGQGQAAAARSWVRRTMSSPGDVGSFGDAQMEVQKLADPDQQAMYEFDASVANTQKQSIPGTQLKGVAASQVADFFEQRGLTCADQGGIVACEKSSGDLRGVIQPDDSGSGVQFYDVGVLPASGDQTAKARDVFDAAVRLGLRGDDARKGVSWVDAHLDGGSHDVVMDGVHLSIFPESSRDLRQGGGADVLVGAWHW
jgi:hypothetical protein